MTRACAAGAVAALSLALSAAAPAEAAPRRVVSLDQCADQYVLALTPRPSIAGLSPRADDADAWLRTQARGRPLRRPTFEAITAAEPDLVVRYWGGDPRLLRALAARGVRTVQIDDAVDFAGVRADVRKVAAALERPEAGEALIARMDADLAAARGAGRGQAALYVTPSGFTAGPGTLIDAMLSAAGLRNAARVPGFAAISLERLILAPPPLVVLGFFDARRGDAWGAGRHPAVRRAAAGRTVANLPGSMLGCPIWALSEGARRTAAGARAERRR